MEKKPMLLRLDPIVHKKMTLIAAAKVLGNGGMKLSATKVSEAVVTHYANETFDKLVQDGKLSEEMLDGQKNSGGG